MMIGRLTSRVRRIQHHLWRIGGKPHDTFEVEAELFGQAHGVVVVRRGDRDHSRKAERLPSNARRGGCRLERIAISPMRGQERKADVHVFERIALDETADTDGHASVVQLD